MNKSVICKGCKPSIIESMASPSLPLQHFFFLDASIGFRYEKCESWCLLPFPCSHIGGSRCTIGGSVQFVQCHNVDDYNEFDNPELLPLFTQLGYGQISNMTTMLSAEFQKRSNFCVKDPDADWNQAFNLSFNLDLLATCIQKTKAMRLGFKLKRFVSLLLKLLQPWQSGLEPFRLQIFEFLQALAQGGAKI
ncbi:ABC transporter G family member 24 [Vitis vinifera]|uniref:ABC transporter G family member 24 n=1 Tax=Vitis vinifera TaxID=29760 RepID=A0A438EV11_VITVI|nr:ABC transporter G family member 24 [Vitis vinifera]